MFGATLDDPEGLLEGKGTRIRSMRLDGLGMLKSEPVDALITAAVLQAGWTLDRKAKGELVIQSVSDKQRPRRPRTAPRATGKLPPPSRQSVKLPGVMNALDRRPSAGPPDASPERTWLPIRFFLPATPPPE
jgi:hypothetical protein